ncbi:MAG: ArsR/SmtB family transcription factor [Thermoplasmatota archaeon]
MKVEETFAALADPTRLALLKRLEAGEQTLSELASPFPVTLMAIQKHVRFLEDAGLVKTRKVGRSRYVRIHPDGLRPLDVWLRKSEERWNAAFDRLEKALEEEEP